jgi:serine/threonine-protein kinase
VEGTEFAGHLIEAEIGRGGMGIVYRARHLALDRIRALKVLAPELSGDDAYALRFRRECRLAASVEHPNLVTIHHAGEEAGRLYMSMQYIDGVDLGRLLADGPLPTERTLRILDDLAGALDAAHAHGLIHRDVKPENVLLTGTVEQERAHLTDFGIGTMADASGSRATRMTGRGVILGTTDYVAPEQIRGFDVDPATDIYSLGCVAFHMLTGAPPFTGDNQLAVLTAHGSAPRPRVSAAAPAIDPALDEVVAEAMAIDPAERPATATAFTRRLRSAGSVPNRPVSGASGRSEQSTRPLAPPPRRLGRRLVTAIVVGALAAIGAWLILGGSGVHAAGPETESADAGFDVPRGPVAVAVGAERTWVASRNADRVTAIDRNGERPLGRGFTIEDPRELTLGFGYLWATGRDGLFRISLDGSDIDRVLELTDPSDVAVDRRHVWVLDRQPQPRALSFDPDRLAVDGEAFVGPDPRALAAGAGGIWVTNTGDGTVSEIDPATAATVGRPIATGGRPTDVAAGAGEVWVVDNFGGRLIPIDPSPPSGTPTAGEPTDTAARPRGVAVGFGSVWVSSGENGVVDRFARSTAELQATIAVGDDPADVDIGAGAVWTADEDSSTVSRINP